MKTVIISLEKGMGTAFSLTPVSLVLACPSYGCDRKGI